MGKCVECEHFKSVNDYCAFKGCLTTPGNRCGGFSRDSRKVFNAFALSEDEAAACMELVQKMREEKERKEKIQKTKNEISFAIAAAIPEIGMEEVKRIVRELNRELRELPIEES